MNDITIDTQDLGVATYTMDYCPSTHHFAVTLKVHTNRDQTWGWGSSLLFVTSGRSRERALYAMMEQLGAASTAVRFFKGDDSNGFVSDDGREHGVLWQAWLKLAEVRKSTPIREDMTDGTPDCVLAAQAAA